MERTITIQRYANNGYGIGYINGQTVFVPYSVVDDVLSVTITQKHKNYSFATITDIITPSPHRIQPQCPAFTQCGGCDFLHIPYEHELSIKKALFINTLLHIGSLTQSQIPEITVLSDNRHKYRSHATVQSDGTVIGFYKKDSHSIHPLPTHGCLLLDQRINEALLSQKWGQSPIKIAVDANGVICSDPTSTFTEMEASLYYTRSLDTFFQANKYLRGKMLTLIDELSQGYTSFLDAGCGVGFFSILLARRMKGVGIDTNVKSIEFAKQNAIYNNVGVQFYATSLENYHPCQNYHDYVIIDPPRQGISKRGRKTIVAMNPSCIIYVSCNPVTFARDVKSFIDSNYRLEKLYVIDMFPCTHHTEVIGLLTRKTTLK